MTATQNGKPTRKQLSDQLNRLDGILDVLADALPQAVADACKEGAKQAVKDAVLELLSNPDVRNMLTAGAPTPPPVPSPAPKPSWWAKLKSEVRAVKDPLVERARAAFTTVTATARLLAAVLPWKRIALVGGGVGLAVGLLCLVCPPLVAASVSALGGVVATATAQVIGALRRAGLLAAH